MNPVGCNNRLIDIRVKFPSPSPPAITLMQIMPSSYQWGFSDLRLYYNILKTLIVIILMYRYIPNTYYLSKRCFIFIFMCHPAARSASTAWYYSYWNWSRWPDGQHRITFRYSKYLYYKCVCTRSPRRTNPIVNTIEYWRPRDIL